VEHSRPCEAYSSSAGQNISPSSVEPIFTRACHWILSWARWIQSISSHRFLKKS